MAGLDGGRLVQMGTPGEVCEAAATPGTARLFRLGDVLPGRATPEGDTTRIDLDGLTVCAEGRYTGDVEAKIYAAGTELSLRPAGGLLLAEVRAVVRGTQPRG